VKRQLYDKPWNVHLERVRGGVQSVLSYLSRYTQRVAISNHRILKVGNGQVSFAYKDHRDGQHKRMSLEVMEFSRRFLQHILPRGFTRIRYFGLLAPVCSHTFDQAIALIGRSLPWPKLAGLSSLEVLRELTGKDPLLCPQCHKGRMLRYEVIESSA